MNIQTNIDDVRAEIMRLEAAPHFDDAAWSRVLAYLSSAGRVSALDDAKRRMETARSNQPAVAVETLEVKCNCKYQLIAHVMAEAFNSSNCLVCGKPLAQLAVETGYNADGKLKSYWVQRKDDDWGMWIHAESVGKAKAIYQSKDPSLEGANFTDLRATRPARGADLLDCTPFTDDTLRLAGYRYENEDFSDPFLDFCPCSMCRYELMKPEYQKVEA